MLPLTLPLFPLPNVVLFPNVLLPLHIFEPRYRTMVANALDGDRIIGMTLLKPGYEADPDGRPPVYAIGCAGVVTHAQALADGRYEIVLRGLDKFRIAREDATRAYRIGHIEALPETVSPGDVEPLRHLRLRLEAVLAAAMERARAEPRFPAAIPDEDLVNGLAQYLDFDAVEHQALLECDGTLARCRALINLLAMKTLTPKWRERAVH